MYLVTIFQGDGIHTQYAKKSRPTYNQLRDAVGGSLQVSYSSKYDDLRGRAYVDEEGRLKNLPLNEKASAARKAALDPNIPLRYEPRLHGPVVFVGRIPANKKEY